jgi:PRTRC genetic system protein C
MALNVTTLERVFKHDKKQLDDPGAHMTPEDVLGFYGNQIPELTTATISGPEIKDGKAVYTFKSTVGTKG